MVEVAALAALIVAAVALVVALAQLTQQLLATAYVIKKCDRIVTGGLTKGGTRQWHWRQFRFTVKYNAIIFALPRPVYKSLEIESTIHINSPSKVILYRATEMRKKRTPSQGCWVSLIQDLVHFSALTDESICVREESGDRIPEDLTVAPTRVDCLTVLLSCIAMGMQVFKYSPTTGEMALSGGVGSISSSTHPVLGGLLHYSVFADEPATGIEKFQQHGRALSGKHGIWANAVFGRFRDRSHSYEYDMVSLGELQNRKIQTLRGQNWPEDQDEASNKDTIGGAACFMAFGHVDACQSVPPSVVRVWCAHFAEMIVKAHHVDSLQRISKGDPVSEIPDWIRHTLTKPDLYSSPYQRRWSEQPLVLNRESPPQAGYLASYSNFLLLPSAFLEQKLARKGWENLSTDGRDPSSYCPLPVLWESLYLIDYHLQVLMTFLSDRVLQSPDATPQMREWVLLIVARSIRDLASVGCPSWTTTPELLRNWPQNFFTACEEVLHDLSKQGLPALSCEVDLFRRVMRLIADLSVLRSAYYTVMMRAAHPIGPGLTQQSNIETALAYMA